MGAAIALLSDLDLDVRFVAYLAQPGLQLFLIFAVAQERLRLLLAELFARIRSATSQYFEDMPAIGRLEGLGQLTIRCVGHDLAELRYQRAWIDPIEVAAVER